MLFQWLVLLAGALLAVLDKLVLLFAALSGGIDDEMEGPGGAESELAPGSSRHQLSLMVPMLFERMRSGRAERIVTPAASCSSNTRLLLGGAATALGCGVKDRRSGKERGMPVAGEASQPVDLAPDNSKLALQVWLPVSPFLFPCRPCCLRPLFSAGDRSGRLRSEKGGTWTTGNIGLGVMHAPFHSSELSHVRSLSLLQVDEVLPWGDVWVYHHRALTVYGAHPPAHSTVRRSQLQGDCCRSSVNVSAS